VADCSNDRHKVNDAVLLVKVVVSPCEGLVFAPEVEHEL
jgi:hypothetical protein